MKRDYNIAEMSNDISEKISQAYDKNFYSNYDIWNNLDNKINTQTSIIHINNKNAVRTDRIITALKSMISSLVVIVFLYIGYTIIRKKVILTIGIPIVVIVSIMYISVNYYVSYKQTIADQSKSVVREVEKGLLKTVAKNILPPEALQCPTECQIDPEVIESPLDKPPKFEKTKYNQDYPVNIRRCSSNIRL